MEHEKVEGSVNLQYWGWIQSLVKWSCRRNMVTVTPIWDESNIKEKISAMVWQQKCNSVSWESSLPLKDKTPVFHRRTKHIEIDVHFVKNKINSGEFELKYVQSKNQIADIITKALSSNSFEYLRNKLNVYTDTWVWEGVLKLQLFDEMLERNIVNGKQIGWS